jgi:hypothetical protein
VPLSDESFIGPPNSRRRSRHEAQRRGAVRLLDAKPFRCTAGFRGGLCPLWVIHDREGRSRTTAYVRFAPKADKKQVVSVCLLRAKSEHMHRNEQDRYEQRPDRSLAAMHPSAAPWPLPAELQSKSSVPARPRSGAIRSRRL